MFAAQNFSVFPSKSYWEGPKTSQYFFVKTWNKMHIQKSADGSWEIGHGNPPADFKLDLAGIKKKTNTAKNKVIIWNRK